MKRLLKRLTAFAVLATATALPAPAADEPQAIDLKPRDLTPVTWLEAPKHAPVEIVREGKAKAVVYIADPTEEANFDYDRFNEIWGDIVPPPALPRLLHELGEVVRIATGGRVLETARLGSSWRPDGHSQRSSCGRRR